MSARFAYAQVRLQARHGVRPDGTVWRSLQGTTNFANYLQLARHTPLRPWVATLDPDMDSDAVEAELRRLFRRHVDEVARWVAPGWRPAVTWVRRLPDLPALQYLQTGEPVPAWLLEDPELRELGCLPADRRMDSGQHPECKVFFEAGLAGASLTEAWLLRWRSLWPRSARMDSGLKKLSRGLHGYLQVLQAEAAGSVQARGDALEVLLCRAFRRYSFQPAAVFSHLALTALDLVRLRGDLLLRQLFATNLEQVA